MSNSRPLSFNRILLSIGIFIYFTTITSVNTQSDRTDAARKNSNNASESMRSALSNSAAAVDLFGPLWFPRTFAIACCMGGRPVPEIDDAKLISNWSTVVDDDNPPPAPSGRLTIDRMRLRTAVGGSNGAFDLGSLMSGGDGADNDQDRCIRYKGKYLLSAAALLSSINGGGSGGSGGLGVRCECPDTTAGVGSRLDRNCHYLPACANNGYRAFSINLRCACPEPYFGDTCEKFCDQGQRLKGIDGRDYCSCLPFYQGDECRDMICLNGGTEVKGRCLCASNYLGYHCEIDTNRTSGGGVGGSGRFHRYDQSSDLFTRDISGTIFSLIMIIVLVVSMYLLMKHRMQVQQRYARRGDDYARSLPTSRRIGTDDLIDDAQILPYQQRSNAPGGGGPPPYMPIVVESIVSSGGTMRHHHQRSVGHHRGHELLPPLPTYEDATKLPPLVIAPVTANRSRRGAPRQHRSVATTATSADASCGSAPPVTRMTMTSSVSEQQPESSSSSSSTAIITPTTSSANTTKLIFTTMASTAIVPTIHRNSSSRRSV